MMFQSTSVSKGGFNRPYSDNEQGLNVRPHLPLRSYSKEELERLVPQSLALAEKFKARREAQLKLRQQKQMERPRGQIDLSDVESLTSLMHAKAIPIKTLDFDDDRSSNSDGQNSETLTADEYDETLEESLALIEKKKKAVVDESPKRLLSTHSGSDLRSLIHSKLSKKSDSVGTANASFKRSATVGNNLNKARPRPTTPANSLVSITLTEKSLKNVSPREERGGECQDALSKDYMRSGSFTNLITKAKARIRPKTGRSHQPQPQDESTPARNNDKLVAKSPAQVAPNKAPPPPGPEASDLSDDKAEIWRQMQAMAQSQMQNNEALMKREAALRSQVAEIAAASTPLAWKARPVLMEEARRETANATFAKRSTPSGTNPLLDKLRTKSPPSIAGNNNPFLPLNRSPISAIPNDSPLFLPPKNLSSKQAPPASHLTSNSAAMKRAVTVGGSLSQSNKMSSTLPVPSAPPLKEDSSAATLPAASAIKRNTSFGNSIIRNISFGNSGNMKRNTSFGNGMKRNTSFGNMLSNTKAKLLNKTRTSNTTFVGSSASQTNKLPTVPADSPLSLQSPSEPSETSSSGDHDRQDSMNAEIGSKKSKKKSLSKRIKASLPFGNKAGKDFGQKFDAVSFFGMSSTDLTDVSESSRAFMDQSDRIEVKKLQDSQSDLVVLKQHDLLENIQEENAPDEEEGAPIVDESLRVENILEEDLSEDSDIDEDLSEDSDIDSDDGISSSPQNLKSCMKVKKLQDSLNKCRGLDSPNLVPTRRETPSEVIVASRSKLTSGAYMNGNLGNYLEKLRSDEMANESSRTASMTDSEPTAEARGLRWGSVTIRKYQQCLGDNPACSEGAPIQLDWDFELAGIVQVERFEADRGPSHRDDDRSLRIPAAYRQFMLLSMGYTLDQVAMAVLLKQKAQKRRIQTVSRLRFMSFDEQVEKMKLMKIFPDQSRNASAVERATVS